MEIQHLRHNSDELEIFGMDRLYSLTQPEVF